MTWEKNLVPSQDCGDCEWLVSDLEHCMLPQQAHMLYLVLVMWMCLRLSAGRLTLLIFCEWDNKHLKIAFVGFLLKASMLHLFCISGYTHQHQLPAVAYDIYVDGHIGKLNVWGLEL